MGNAWAGDVSAVNTKGIFNQAAIKGNDAVGFWLEKAPRKGSKAFTVEWHGATWHFSRQANKALGPRKKYFIQ